MLLMSSFTKSYDGKSNDYYVLQIGSYNRRTDLYNFLFCFVMFFWLFCPAPDWWKKIKLFKHERKHLGLILFCICVQLDIKQGLIQAKMEIGHHQLWDA